MSRGPWNIHVYRLLPAFGELKNALKYVCQLRIYYCHIKCVLFAHVCKFNSVRYICNIYHWVYVLNEQYMPLNSAFLTQKKYCFWPQIPLCPNCFKKACKSGQILNLWQERICLDKMILSILVERTTAPSWRVTRNFIFKQTSYLGGRVGYGEAGRAGLDH